jgi:hypothetical protein
MVDTLSNNESSKLNNNLKPADQDNKKTTNWFSDYLDQSEKQTWFMMRVISFPLTFFRWLIFRKGSLKNYLRSEETLINVVIFYVILIIVFALSMEFQN